MIEGIGLLNDEAPASRGRVKAAWHQILDSHPTATRGRWQFAHTPYDTQLMEPSIQIV